MTVKKKYLEEDNRIEQIYAMLIQYTTSNFSVRMVPSEKGDELDAIIVGLNTLGEELQSSGRILSSFEDRINRMMQTLLQYTLMDFSTPLEVTDAGDELDAIAVGLNTLVEELRAANEVKLEYIAKLEAQTAEIKKLNDNLRQNNLSLESSNKELDAFTYSVSHDLRAPLRAIHGYSRIMLDDHTDQLDEEGKNMLHSVMRNAKQMGQLIDDLLSFSRTGKSELRKIQVDIEQLVEEVLLEQRRITGNKSKVMIQELPPALVDRNLMAQVFANLISNAFKYSRNNPDAQIEIGASQDKNYTTYYVKDNGVGFDMAYADKLFGVFHRLHSAEEFEGTGVGLALVKRIITRHGGDVWAEAKLGEGAKLSFKLPK